MSSALNLRDRRFVILDGAAMIAPEHRGAVIAIGNFDGVHRGHQALLGAVRSRAAELRTASGVMVFEPHPRLFFRPELPHFTLTPRSRQMQLFAHFGLDHAITLPFDRALSQLSARAFAEDILVGRLGVAHVVIGYDFSFGRDRSGTAAAMVAFGADLGFAVTVIAPVGDAPGEPVFSSSTIRTSLARGDVAGANRALGHRWRVTGPVVNGAKRGTDLGFPTANIAMPPGTTLGHGIFAAWVCVDGARYDAAAYFGKRPQFDNGPAILEVFLLDFHGDLYGREISIIVVDFIRGDGAFEGIEALKRQMAADCARAAAILRAVAAADPLANLPLGSA